MNVPRFLRRLWSEPYDGLRHFGVVAEGVLYRCGQPRPAELRDLIQRYGLRTVVSLRGSRSADDPDGWEQAERTVCESANVDFQILPCNHKNPPTEEQVSRFLRLTQRRECRPVLVHCRLGQQRTLMFCGLYRVHVDGADPEAVLEEIDALGFNSRHRRHQRLLAAFRALGAVPTERLLAARAESG